MSQKRTYAVLLLWAGVGFLGGGSNGAAAQSGSQIMTEPERRVISTQPGDVQFDVTRHSIPLREVRGGGPPTDGIPALSDPAFVSAEDAGSLRSGDTVLGISLEGAAKAYPIRILNWHELVNDRIGARPILVTW